MMALVIAGALPANAQFGKLLDKVKGKSAAGKKSGNFATVWESEFDNKASRLALCDSDGQYIIGTFSIPATLTGNGYFVFEYTGNETITTTVQIDDILIN